MICLLPTSVQDRFDNVGYVQKALRAFHRFCISYNEVMKMNSLKLTAAVTALANAIACNMTVSELAVIAGILVQLGDTLATIAAQRGSREDMAEETVKNTIQAK